MDMESLLVQDQALCMRFFAIRGINNIFLRAKSRRRAIVSHIVVLLLRKLLLLMSCAPFFLASATVSSPDFSVSRKEPVTKAYTTCIFQASITSYCKASTALTSALRTVEPSPHALSAQVTLEQLVPSVDNILRFLQPVLLRLNDILSYH